MSMAFCVGAPWNSVAVDLGIGHILHFVSEILSRAAEKLLAVRQRWADENPDVLMRLVRAHAKAADFVEDAGNRDEVAALLAAPNRIGVEPDVIRRTLDGRLKVSPDGAYRNDARYLLVGRAGARGPIPRRRRGSMRRWCAGGRRRCRARCSPPRRRCGVPTCMRPRSAARQRPRPGEPADGIGAFAGPAFDPDDIEAHLAAWKIKRVP